MAGRIENTLRAKRSGFWTTNLPRFDRNIRRSILGEDHLDRETDDQNPGAQVARPTNLTDAESETLFEAALLSMEDNRRALSTLEIARRLHRDWMPPEDSFQLTDKTI